jgi:hypothetical protein
MSVTAALAVGCGSDDSSAPPITALRSVEEWCTTLDQTLPALSSPSPNGREIEYIDMYVARYDVLSRDTPGVPASAIAAAAEFRDAFVDLRDDVEAGTPLSTLLADNWAKTGHIWVAGTRLSDEASVICP